MFVLYPNQIFAFLHYIFTLSECISAKMKMQYSTAARNNNTVQCQYSVRYSRFTVYFLRIKDFTMYYFQNYTMYYFQNYLLIRDYITSEPRISANSRLYVLT
jgi:hypothetical protein